MRAIGDGRICFRHPPAPIRTTVGGNNDSEVCTTSEMNYCGSDDVIPSSRGIARGLHMHIRDHVATASPTRCTAPEDLQRRRQQSQNLLISHGSATDW
jgi:hypothetical protein